MRTFTAAILLDSWATLDGRDPSRSHMDAENRTDCCDDIADALAAGVTGSLLEAYVTACVTGVAVEYVLPCDVSVHTYAPPVTARDANPAK